MSVLKKFIGTISRQRLFRYNSKFDKNLLKKWKELPITYDIDYDTVSDFQKHKEHVLKFDNSDYKVNIKSKCVKKYVKKEDFEKLTVLLKDYNFFPPVLMDTISDFKEENRIMKFKDNIVQRINLVPWLPESSKFLEILTMDRVANVINTSDKKQYTLVTTEAHDEFGEHNIYIDHKDNKEVWLSQISRSKMDKQFKSAMLIYANLVNKRAHQLGFDNFEKRILDILNEKPN